MLKRARRIAAAATNRNPAAQPSRPSEASPHAEGQDRRRDAEGNDVGQRVELDAEFAGGARQPRDAAVEHVEHDRKADERRGRFELAAHRVDDARVAAEHVAHRDQAGQQVHAAPDALARSILGAAEEADASLGLCQHGYLECSTAMTVSPPRTLSPTFTVMAAFAGTNTSMRDPNFMMPSRSPAFTLAPSVEPAHDAARQDADDLTRHDVLALVVDPDLAALVDRGRFAAVRGQEPPAWSAPRA